MRRRLRVHVDVDHGRAHVRLVRWRMSITSYATVARIDLTAPNADDLLAEARMRARDLADQLNGLEGRP